MTVLNKDFFYKKSRLQQLKGFFYTYKFSTVTKASEFMGLNPSTVTLQIQSLERDLNIKLFKRKGRNIVPTKDGHLFYKILAPRLQAIDGIFEYFKDKKTGLENERIRIAAQHSIINYMLPGYLKKFTRENPKAKILIQDITKSEAIEKLINEEADIALYAGLSPNTPEIEFQKIISLYPAILMHKNNILVKKKDCDITLEDLSKQQMILIDKKQILPYFVKTCEEFNIGSNIEFEKGGDWETVQKFVKLEMGICLFNEAYERFPIFKDESIISKNIQHLLPAIDVYVMLKHGTIKNDLIKEFIKIIDYSYFEDK